MDSNSSQRPFIILVEDDKRLAEYMAEFLSDEGFDIKVVGNGTDAISEIVDHQPDLTILDIMLPGTDGVEVCRKVRQSYAKPIIMLTAAGNDFAEISSLNSGADSYLNKPVKPQVLLAHIQATLRRESQTEADAPQTINAQNITIDANKMSASLDDKDLLLTSGEFELLWILMDNAGVVVSRDELYQKTRGIEYDGLDRSIDLRISQIRKKMVDETTPYKYIKTIRNKGYLFAI